MLTAQICLLISYRSVYDLVAAFVQNGNEPSMCKEVGGNLAKQNGSYVMKLFLVVILG